jgi:thioredoxin 1
MNSLYFKAAWCSACKLMLPTIQKLQKEGYNIKIIDTDIDTKLAQVNKISSLPTLVIFTGGKEVDRIVGVTDIEEVRKQLKKDLDYILW